MIDFGNANSAYSFDGISSYISLPNSTSLSFNKSHFSISIWFLLGYKNNPSDTWMTLISKDRVNAPDGYQLYINYSSLQTKQMIYMEANTSKAITWPWKSSIIDTTKWHNIIIVKDSLNYSMYIDGNFNQSTSVASYIDQTANSNNLLFGAKHNSSGVVV